MEKFPLPVPNYAIKFLEKMREDELERFSSLIFSIAYREKLLEHPSAELEYNVHLLLKKVGKVQSTLESLDYLMQHLDVDRLQTLVEEMQAPAVPIIQIMGVTAQPETTTSNTTKHISSNGVRRNNSYVEYVETVSDIVDTKISDDGDLFNDDPDFA